MGDEKLSYEEMRDRLGRAEAIVNSLRRGEVDLVIGSAEPIIIQLRSLAEEKKKSEEALRSSRERLNHLFTVNPAIVYELDPENFSSTWVSPNITEMTGYTPEEALQPRWWIEHVHPEHREWAEKVPDRLRGKGRAVHEYRFEKKDGEYIWVRDELRLVRNEQGTPVNIVGTWMDITERKRADDEGKKLREQLQHSQKMEAIGVLAGGVAHDFNNLLTTILGNAQLVLGELEKEDPHVEDLEEIRKAGEKAANLTRQLLTFSRRETRVPELLDLNKALEEMEKMLGRLIREDIDLKVMPGPDLWPVYMDPTQMDQIIMNLAINARDAMPDGGTLTIETANTELDRAYFIQHGIQNKPGPYVMLAVTDTGVGMDEAVQRQMFDPFFSTKERGTGTGLGLATVYGIVKQNKGYIWTYSEPGQGTTMKVYLPRAGEGIEPGQRDDVQTDELTGDETVLVVEDNDSVRKMAGKFLNKSGYHVLEAASGKEAIEICGRFQGTIHLLITDVVMPGMNGKELSEKLRSERPDMKVLFMSGYTQNIIMQKGILPADIRYIQKPFSGRVLARKVREVIEGQGE